MRSLLLVILAALSATASGCAVGAILYQTLGPGDVPAKWVPPKEPTLIFVENVRATPAGDADCDRLVHFVSADLKTNNVVPMVAQKPLLDLREQDPSNYEKMSIAALGRLAGAKQVIYVSVEQYGPDGTMGSDAIKWTATVKVRVVDSQTGASRWPADLADGMPVKAETDYSSKNTQANEMAVRDDLNQHLAVKIGQLFHKWAPESDTAEDYQQSMPP